MKIKEILSDNQLYEMWLLMTDAMWETLVDHYSANDVYEGYPVRRRIAVRPIRRVPIQRPPKNLTRKPVIAPARRLQQPIKRPVTQPTKPVRKPQQTTGLNPKINPMNGPDFKLDDRNIIPKNSD